MGTSLEARFARYGEAIVAKNGVKNGVRFTYKRFKNGVRFTYKRLNWRAAGGERTSRWRNVRSWRRPWRESHLCKNGVRFTYSVAGRFEETIEGNGGVNRVTCARIHSFDEQAWGSKRQQKGSETLSDEQGWGFLEDGRRLPCRVSDVWICPGFRNTLFSAVTTANRAFCVSRTTAVT